MLHKRQVYDSVGHEAPESVHRLKHDGYLSQPNQKNQHSAHDRKETQHIQHQQTQKLLVKAAVIAGSVDERDWGESAWKQVCKCIPAYMIHLKTKAKGPMIWARHFAALCEPQRGIA
jgi:hypothetical protein